MYGVLAGTWYFAPGSNSASVRGVGGASPWYLRRRSHHAWLYLSFGVLPEKTSHRHLSMRKPNGRKAILLSASFICWLICAFLLLGTASRSPRFFRYCGVTESASVSPMPSWKPSFAPAWNSIGSL